MMNTHKICFHGELREILTLVMLNQDISSFANNVDPDQLASSDEAN